MGGQGDSSDDNAVVQDPCSGSREAIRQVAEEIVAGRGDTLVQASRIYWIAETGASGNEAPCEELSDVGVEFLLLAELLEANQDHDEARAAWDLLIRDAATSYLDGKPFPEYRGPLDGPHPRLPVRRT